MPTKEKTMASPSTATKAPPLRCTSLTGFRHRFSSQLGTSEITALTAKPEHLAACSAPSQYVVEFIATSPLNSDHTALPKTSMLSTSIYYSILYTRTTLLFIAAILQEFSFWGSCAAFLVKYCDEDVGPHWMTGGMLVFRSLSPPHEPMTSNDHIQTFELELFVIWTKDDKGVPLGIKAFLSHFWPKNFWPKKMIDPATPKRTGYTTILIFAL